MVGVTSEDHLPGRLVAGLETATRENHSFADSSIPVNQTRGKTPGGWDLMTNVKPSLLALVMNADWPMGYDLAYFQETHISVSIGSVNYLYSSL